MNINLSAIGLANGTVDHTFLPQLFDQSGGVAALVQHAACDIGKHECLGVAASENPQHIELFRRDVKRLQMHRLKVVQPAAGKKYVDSRLMVLTFKILLPDVLFKAHMQI